MARTGMNPLRTAKTPALPSHVTAAIVHIPDETDYHKHRREVVRVCLDSMTKHAGMPHHLIIWDNGSSAKIHRWLQDRYKDATIIRSPNIGKSNARAAIFGMLPDETMLNMSDDDMFYYPGWLAELDRVYRHFDRVGNCGLVTGYPVRTSFRWGNVQTVRWGARFGKLEHGAFIKAEYDRDFCTSIGRDYDWHVEHSQDVREVVINYQGMRVLATGHHCQFYGNVGKLRPFVFRINHAMADEKPLDNAIDAAGLLRLATIERYSRHIGNVLDDGINAEVLRYGL